MTPDAPKAGPMKPFPRTKALEKVRKLLPKITVEDDPYDIGYWAHVAGFSKPSDPEMRRGWMQAREDGWGIAA